MVVQMQYHALPMNGDRFIFVEHDADTREIDPFIELLRSVQSELRGELNPRPENGFCYELAAGELRLLFRWDSEAGIRIAVPEETDGQAAFALLHRHCERLNAPKPELHGSRASVRRTEKKTKG